MIDRIAGYDNPAVGVGNVVNEVALSYNDFGQLVTDQQSHSGSVVSSTPKVHDEFLHRLKDMARGRLDAQHTGLSAKTFAQCWTLDETGNWKRFQEDDTGAGTWSLVQDRTANRVNEITDITESTGPAWVTPAYDPAGNMTTIPKPADPTQGFSAVYDAWNRLVKLSDSSGTVQENEYDGRNFRVVRKDYSGGVLTETRHFYYTSAWQVLEERVDSSSNPDRQFVWGLRYIDDCVLRDRDTSGNGVLDERLYALHDGNWNVTAVTDENGDVQERYAYTAYGEPLFLSPSFVEQSGSSFGWEVLFTGQRWDGGSGLYLFRMRVYCAGVGVFVQRDWLGYTDGTNLYCPNYAPSQTDPFGLAKSNFWLLLSWWDYDWWTADDQLQPKWKWASSFSANIWCDKQGNAHGRAFSHRSIGRTDFWWGSSYIGSDIKGYVVPVAGSDRKGYQIHVFSAVETDGGYLAWAAGSAGAAAGWFLGTAGGTPTGPGAIATGLAGAAVGGVAGAWLANFFASGGSAWEARFTYDCVKCCNTLKRIDTYLPRKIKEEFAYRPGEYYPKGRCENPWVWAAETGSCQPRDWYQTFRETHGTEKKFK